MSDGTPRQSGSVATGRQARVGAVQNFRDFLTGVLAEARALGGWAGFDLTVYGGPEFEALAGTYPPANQLPDAGQRLWRRLEGLIDTNLRDDQDPVPDWAALTGVVDEFLRWLTTQYTADGGSADPDPGDYDRRIRFDDAARTVYLLDLPYSVPRAAHVRLLRELVRAAKAGQPPIPMWRLSKAVLGREDRRKSIQRLRRSLPPALASLIRGHAGEGLSLLLPPAP